MVATLLNPVLDTTDCRRSADFWCRVLGLTVARASDDWVVLTHPDGRRALALQQVDSLEASTWPEPGVPQQLHLDCTVPDVAALTRTRDEALALGARLLHDRSDHAEEPLYVLADPDGHPFCIFVVAQTTTPGG